MKKIIFISIATSIIFCSSCGKAPKQMEPELSQMKSICELATMDCYYHNVAKYSEEDAQGILWWKKDKNFWVEYDGIVTAGVDASLIDIQVHGEKITITMPQAKVLSCKVDKDTLTQNSFIVAQDSAKINAEDQTEAFKIAQENIKKNASEDEALLSNAQLRAKKLLEDYVENVGDAVGKQYQIKWKYIEE